MVAGIFLGRSPPPFVPSSSSSSAWAWFCPFCDLWRLSGRAWLGPSGSWRKPLGWDRGRGTVVPNRDRLGYSDGGCSSSCKLETPARPVRGSDISHGRAWLGPSGSWRKPLGWDRGRGTVVPNRDRLGYSDGGCSSSCKLEPPARPVRGSDTSHGRAAGRQGALGSR